jgi:hypothetical protein
MSTVSPSLPSRHDSSHSWSLLPPLSRVLAGGASVFGGLIECGERASDVVCEEAELK